MSKKVRLSRWAAALTAVGAGAALFLYFYFRINPELIYQSQQPVFFFDPLFYRELNDLPGAPLLWTSRLLQQLTYNRVLGSLMLALLLAAVPPLFGRVLAAASGRKPQPAFAWLPLPLLLVLTSRYTLPLTPVVGLFAVLLATLLYFKLPLSRPLLRAAAFTAIFTGLYFAAGAPALLFALLVAVTELFRAPMISAVAVAEALLVPWLSVERLYLMTVREAFTHHLELTADKRLWASPGVLWLLIPVILTMQLLLARRAPAAAQGQRRFVASVLNIAAVVLLLGLAAVVPLDNDLQKLLYLDYYARRGEWKQVLKTAEDGLIHTYIGQFQANRALYHQGRLCSSMFNYEQRAGIDGLFLHESMRPTYPLAFSDLFFELGWINEAQHWAHESLSVFGDTPWNLQRLAEVNLLKGEKEAARKCLSLLKRTFWHRRWARDFERYVGLPPEQWPRRLQELKRRMPTKDFLFAPSEPERGLEDLLQADPTNKAAYEYKLASCLLLGKVGRLMNHTDRLDELGYRQIPRHVEEAMLLFIRNAGLRDHKIPSCGFSPATLLDFKQVLAVAEKHGNNLSAALPEMRRFSNTYWFYAMYRLKKQ